MSYKGKIAEFDTSDGLTPQQVRKLNYNFKSLQEAGLNSSTDEAVIRSSLQIQEASSSLRQALEIEVANRKAADSELWDFVQDYMHPVGSTYITFGSEDPNTMVISGTDKRIMKGTWQKVAQGRMLLGAGVDDFTDPTDPYTYNVNATGGEKNVTLQSDQIPKHAHNVTGGSVSNGITGGNHSHIENDATLMWVGSGGNVGTPAGTTIYSNTIKQWRTKGETHKHDLPNHIHTVSEVGNDKSHNNMPPYIAVNIWKRVS